MKQRIAAGTFAEHTNCYPTSRRSGLREKERNPMDQKLHPTVLQQTTALLLLCKKAERFADQWWKENPHSPFFENRFYKRLLFQF